MKSIIVNGKRLNLPAFFPDATFGTVKMLTPADLVSLSISGIVTTTLPAKSYGVTELSKNFGGFSNFLNVPSMPVLTDSGGFQLQVFIYMRGVNVGGKTVKPNPEKWITEDGCFLPDLKTNQKFLLTPELSQQVQAELNSDMRVVLDEPLPFGADYSVVKASLERTARWAKRSKDEFLRLLNITENDFNKDSDNFMDTAVLNRPMLFAVAQGANFLDLRKESTQRLVDINFDGVGWGGMSVDESKKLSLTLLEEIKKNMPRNKLLYAMGVGTPDDLVNCSKIGAMLFDCTIPTRNARHGYIFTSKSQAESMGEHYDVLRIGKPVYQYEKKLIDPLLSENPDYPAECRISRSLLRHLFKIKDPASYRIATMHNLYFYNFVIRELCSGVHLRS